MGSFGAFGFLKSRSRGLFVSEVALANEVFAEKVRVVFSTGNGVVELLASN